MKVVSLVLPILSTSVGIALGLSVVPSCGSDCGCSGGPPITEGQFRITGQLLGPDSADDLKDLRFVGLVIETDTVVVHYQRGQERGTATYPNVTKYE